MIQLRESGTTDFPGFGHYIISLLSFGALLAAAIYFGFAAFADPDKRAAKALTAAAGFTIVQLTLETLRIFVVYSYPWQIARVAGILILSGATSVAFAAYAAERFDRSERRIVVTATIVGVAAGALLIPGFDGKALCAMAAGAIAVTVSAFVGVYRKTSGAKLAAAAGLTALILIFIQQSDFLDRGWYLLVAAALTALIVEQLIELKRTREDLGELTRRLVQLKMSDQAVILKDGSRVHRVNARDIVSLKAADDYCEVKLTNGHGLLASSSLSKLLEGLPGRFLRIHRSHAVNKSHVVGIISGRSGRTVRLNDGTHLPIGRSYVEDTRNWFFASDEGDSLFKD